MKKISWLLVGAFLMMGLAACSGGDDDTASPSPEVTPTATAAPSAN
ncbi:MAG: hypothetical protein ACKO6N_16565 [Myxococcota bacterium]